MARRLLAQHPTGHPGQGAVWLTDHKDVRPLMAIPTRDRNRQTEARVEWVEDPSFSLLISASMSLLRPAWANHGSPAHWAIKPAVMGSRCSIGGRHAC